MKGLFVLLAILVYGFLAFDHGYNKGYDKGIADEQYHHILNSLDGIDTSLDKSIKLLDKSVKLLDTLPDME